MLNKDQEFMVASFINSLVKDEWDAVEGYNNAIATLSQFEDEAIDGIIANIEDIRDEEYVHIGQLESCLTTLNNDPVEQIESGSEEGIEKLELPEDEGEEEIEINEATEPRKEHTIKDMDIEEVKDRLKSIGFGAEMIGKSDKELRAMLKLNRQARGTQALKKWKKERNESLNDFPTDVSKLRNRLADINKAIEQGEDPEHFAYEKNKIFDQLDALGANYYDESFEDIDNTSDFELLWEEMNNLEI